MKTKHIFYTIAAGAMLVAFSACQKSELLSEETAGPADNVPEGMVAATFTCSLETPVQTRMTVTDGEGANEKVPTWEAGDEIKIFYLDPSTSEMASTIGTANAGGAETTFSATVPAGVEAFYAVYPATLASSVDASGNFAVPTRVGDSDEPTFANACICIAQSDADKVFHFKNLCSILKFHINMASGILKVSSVNGTPIHGTINASLNSNNEVVYAAEPYTVEEGKNHNTRTMKKPAANTTCYVAVLPGTQAEGVAIDFEKEYNAPAAFAAISLPFERSKIYNLGTVDGKNVKDYYITESGAGTKDGKSWANAGDVATFKNLVGFIDGDSDSPVIRCRRYMQIWKTKGVTFHFGAGTYVFGNAESPRLTIDFYNAYGTLYSQFYIVGGYPAAGGDTPDPEHNVTNFSGNDQYGILNVFDKARVHIDNVTFSHAFSDADACGNGATDDGGAYLDGSNLGAALYLKQKGALSTSNRDKLAPRVWLTNCIFENNVTNHASNATHAHEGGSAINIVHGGVYADHCIFRNNQDKQRNGCVRMSGASNFPSNPAYAFFNACLFTGNTTSGTNNENGGRLIRQNRQGGLLGMYNCTLYDNAGIASGSKNVLMALEKAAIIANCTIVQNDTWLYPIRFNCSGNGNNHFILANNIILQGQTGHSMYMYANSTDAWVYFKGGNVYNTTNGHWLTPGDSQGYKCTRTDADEYGGHPIADIDNMSFSDNVIKWNGTLGNGAVTCNFMSHDTMVDDVLKFDKINQSGDASQVSFSITGSEGQTSFDGFYTWLNRIGAIDVDALGNPRPATGWTPGAYQVQ